mmetsp:Transcript_37034/g.54399  ORF Transcript_37034/g.54399 Transcript_37034/m.54399 type:complete len:90 (-) Transcript_37034:290-559(-)
MAVVTRADCTEIYAKETFEFNYDDSTAKFSMELKAISDISFNACQGSNNRNNDLDAYYERLVNEGKAKEDNLVRLRQILVGDEAGKCNA